MSENLYDPSQIDGKQCSLCGMWSYDLSIFVKGTKGRDKHGVKTTCKECSNLETKLRVWKTNADRQRLILDAKKVPCSICGGTFPDVCLDFHHIDDATKEFSIAEAMYRTISLTRIQLEMNKCKVVCSNCHRIIHWRK